MRQVFYTELALPKTLQDNAHLLSGEYAWAASDGMNVVQWLAERGIAVFGVELWHDKQGCASWIATSHYSAKMPPPVLMKRNGLLMSFSIMRRTPAIYSISPSTQKHLLHI